MSEIRLLHVSLIAGLLWLLCGFFGGVILGQRWLLVEKDRWMREWKEEAAGRQEVLEGALRLVTKDKWDDYAKKVEAARVLRNKEDGRK